MKSLWKICVVLVVVCLLSVLTYLVFGVLAIFTLEGKYDSLTSGLTVEETDRIMGFPFQARTINWDDIPKIYTEHYVARTGAIVREYKFFGISALNIVVVYDENGRSYLKIPCYE